MTDLLHAYARAHGPRAYRIVQDAPRIDAQRRADAAGRAPSAPDPSTSQSPAAGASRDGVPAAPDAPTPVE